MIVTFYLSVCSILQLFKNTDEENNIASYPQGLLGFFKNSFRLTTILSNLLNIEPEY